MKSALLLAALFIVLHNFPECMGCWGRRSRRSTPTTTSRPNTRPQTRPTNTRPTARAPTTTPPTTTPPTPTQNFPRPTRLQTCLCIVGTNVNIQAFACGSVIGRESNGACFSSLDSPGITYRCVGLGIYRSFDYNGGTGWAAAADLALRDSSYCDAEQCPSGGTIGTDRAAGEAVVDQVVQAIRNSGIFPDDNCFLRRIAYVESQFGAHPNTFRSGYFGGIWQVDGIGFDGTQDTASHPGLTAKFAQIQEKLCIDWTTVEWSDLLKPLYSGLAARLYLSVNQTAIPVDLDGQARYWKGYYNTGAGAGTWQKFNDDILASEQPGDCR